MRLARLAILLFTLVSFSIELTDPSTAFVRAHSKTSEMGGLLGGSGGETSWTSPEDLLGGSIPAAQDQSVPHYSDAADLCPLLILVAVFGTVSPPLEDARSVVLHSITYPPELA